MRNLLAFLIRNLAWFVFSILEFLCILMVFQNNSFQHGIFFNAFNEISGNIYYVSGEIKTFINLRTVNEQLVQENGVLEQRVLKLESLVRKQNADSVKVQAILKDSLNQNTTFDFTVAHVENNNISLINNYITVDKGLKMA